MRPPVSDSAYGMRKTRAPARAHKLSAVTLSQNTLSILAVTAVAVAVLSLIVALGFGRRLRSVRRSYSLRHRRGTAAAAAPEAEVELELAEVRDVLARAIQRVGMVRFDAFDDMGGRLSFAVALLDAEGSGVVLSTINGRKETRIYAKPIDRGTSTIDLSGEEAEAIRRALGAVRA